jgi:putative zinc finger protein
MVGEQPSNVTACASKEQDLVLYYYGELGDGERAAVETHMRNCAGCHRYLDQIGSLLPLTVQPDHPEQPFWDEYSREMRHKLDEKEQKSWWQPVKEWLQPWAVPAMAATAVAVIALTFTLGRELFRPTDLPPEDESLMEVLPVAENLDFFANMEILDAMDLLESLGGSGNGQA